MNKNHGGNILIILTIGFLIFFVYTIKLVSTGETDCIWIKGEVTCE